MFFKVFAEHLSNLVHDFGENCCRKPKLLLAANYLNISIGISRSLAPSCSIVFFTKNNYLWNNYLMIFISWNRERGKLILRNYFPFTVFTKRFIVDVWVSLGFRICQSFQYTGVLNMFLNLNVSGFWTYHGSEYARFTQGFKYAWLCLNVLKSVWMAFVLHLPIVIPC